ncbi:MAG: ABC transporter permease [Motiliproteus sp.]
MSLEPIPLPQLLIALIPALVVVGLMWRLQLGHRKALYGLARMLTQLLLIGYVLIYIFQAESSLIVLAVLLVMVLASSWIALGSIEQSGNNRGDGHNIARHSRRSLYLSSLLAISIGGGTTLALITQGVLQLEPWFEPRYLIPLAGMVFANSMNSISLAAERLFSELNHGSSPAQAQQTAFQAAMIPVVNSLFAVGLVSLPGMMTGQILSGVSPFIAARYQIMVMAMIFGSAGISTALFLYWTRQSMTVVQPPGNDSADS